MNTHLNIFSDHYLNLESQHCWLCMKLSEIVSSSFIAGYFDGTQSTQCAASSATPHFLSAFSALGKARAVQSYLLLHSQGTGLAVTQPNSLSFPSFYNRLIAHLHFSISVLSFWRVPLMGQHMKASVLSKMLFWLFTLQTILYLM